MLSERCDLFKENTKLIIYGAGEYGNKLYTFLRLNGLHNRITYFAVSDPKQNPRNIEGTLVKKVSELKDELAESIVLVAVGTAHREEVINLLQKYSVKDLYYITKEDMDYISREIVCHMKRLPLEQNKIFISCYEGMGYRCNCKYIAEKLIQNNYPVKLVWVVRDGNGNDIPEEIKKVKLFSYTFYEELYTSKICITNNTLNLLGEKKEGQYYINTWHGFGPFKKVQGSWISNRNKLDEIKAINSKYDLFLTGSKFYSWVYRNSFFYEGEIYECGAPRNDIFFVDNTVIKKSVFRKYSIPFEKKIVLYAPTFRTDMRDFYNKYIFDMSEILKALSERFHGEYVLMYRFHHHTSPPEERYDYKKGIDVTYYPDIQELLVSADVVITDYSSLMWDFSLQRKPVFLYQNDEKEYITERGFYCPVSQWPYPCAHNKKELINRIKAFDREKYVDELNAFLERYGSCDNGNASKRVAGKIMRIVEGDT